MPNVKPQEDSALLLKLANPIVKRILRSPLHRVLSRHFMLVTFTGRISGRHYTTPTAYVRYKGGIYFATGSQWWKNFQAGEPITVWIAGKEMMAFTDAVTDSRDIAELLRTFMAELGPGKAYLFGLKVEGQGTPTVEEVEAGVQTRRIVIRLTPQA